MEWEWSLHDRARNMKRAPSRERRAAGRIRTSRPVRVRLLTTHVAAQGLLEDINNFGAFVTTTLELNTGTPVRLEIDIPGEPSRTALPAVVARRRSEVCHPRSILPPGLGLKFVAHTKEELELIHRTVNKTLAFSVLVQSNSKHDASDADAAGAFPRSFYRPRP